MTIWATDTETRVITAVLREPQNVRVEIYEKIDQILGVSFKTEKAFGSQLEEHFEATLTYPG